MKSKCFGTEDTVIRDSEVKRQERKGLWLSKDGITGAQERSKDVKHFVVKAKKERFEIKLL